MSADTDIELPYSATRETSIRRDRLGRWFHEGHRIDQPKIKRAFDRWVSICPDGRYCLRHHSDWVYVTIEGPPVWVESIDTKALPWMMLLSLGCSLPLREETLFVDEEGCLCVELGKEGWFAALSNAASTQLMPFVAADDLGIYLHVGGNKVRPPTRSPRAQRPKT